MLIIPHFSAREVLELARGELSMRITPSPRIMAMMEESESVEIGDLARGFIDWTLLPHRSSAYCGCLFKTTLDVIGGISDLTAVVSDFCGGELKLSFDELDAKVDFRNNFCFESYFFAIISLAFLARNYASRRSVDIRIRFDELGIYFDAVIDLATDFANLDLKTNAGELENLIARADERIFDHVCKQEGGRFVFRGFPWLRMPDSADLKEKKREFIYNT